MFLISFFFLGKDIETWLEIPIAYRKSQPWYSVLGRIFKKSHFMILKKHVFILFKVASCLRYRFHSYDFYYYYIYNVTIAL